MGGGGGGGGHDGSQNVFHHSAQTLRRRKLKLGDFNINLWSIKKVIFSSRGYPVLPYQRV